MSRGGKPDVGTAGSHTDRVPSIFYEAGATLPFSGTIEYGY